MQLEVPARTARRVRPLDAFEVVDLLDRHGATNALASPQQLTKLGRRRCVLPVGANRVTRLEDLAEGPVLRDDVVVRGDGECDPPPLAVHDRCWRRLVNVEEVRTNGCVAASRAAEPVEDQIVERPGGEPVVGSLDPRGSEELRAHEEGHGGSRGRREFVGADGPGGRGVKYGQQRGAELGTVERERERSTNPGVPGSARR